MPQAHPEGREGRSPDPTFEPAVSLHLAQSLAALDDQLFQQAALEATAALNIDPLCGPAWHVLARSRERLGDLTAALTAYEAAAQRMPQQPDLASEAGRLAWTVGETERAARHLINYHQARPDSVQGANNLALALGKLHHFGAAIEVLQSTLRANPTSAMLWNTLGSILSDRGEPEMALPCFAEAARLAPGAAKPRYNLATSKLSMGDAAAALEDCDAAIAVAADAAEAALMRLGRSAILLCQGRLGEGWDAYEARLDPAYAAGTQFVIDRPRWDLAASPAGRSVLLFGEQGLGDQVAFAGAIPDLMAELGAGGRLTIAVEPRLAPLFRRSFPGAETVALGSHKLQGRVVRTLPGIDQAAIDQWTPMASTLRRYRRTVEDYPRRACTLAPDPARAAHWRRVLGGLPGLKVGVAWKSLNMEGVRQKFFPSFHHWRPVFDTPGVTFVNLQYGDCAREIDEARSLFGVELWQPPGIDLKDDLDDVAALGSALDLVIGPSNAATCLAAASGAPCWIFTQPASWTFQGTEGLPWFPTVRGYIAERYGDWEPLMRRIAGELAEWARPSGR